MEPHTLSDLEGGDVRRGWALSIVTTSVLTMPTGEWEFGNSSLGKEKFKEPYQWTSVPFFLLSMKWPFFPFLWQINLKPNYICSWFQLFFKIYFWMKILMLKIYNIFEVKLMGLWEKEMWIMCFRICPPITKHFYFLFHK